MVGDGRKKLVNKERYWEVYLQRKSIKVGATVSGVIDNIADPISDSKVTKENLNDGKSEWILV